MQLNNGDLVKYRKGTIIYTVKIVIGCDPVIVHPITGSEYKVSSHVPLIMVACNEGETSSRGVSGFDALKRAGKDDAVDAMLYGIPKGFR